MSHGHLKYELVPRPPDVQRCQMTICLHGRLVLSRLFLSIIGIVKCPLGESRVQAPRLLKGSLA